MFRLWIETINDKEVMVHCDVWVWNMKVARRLDQEVNKMFDELRERGVERLVTVSPNPRFCEYLAGEKIGEELIQGKIHGVYLWELK
jgi:hypothetical protein